ncbi:MAG: hypothetical protein M3Y91_14380 [Actinomycetota bacterium]|nr:hypothetical protein [Actinomycetota bacterium]
MPRPQRILVRHYRPLVGGLGAAWILVICTLVYEAVHLFAHANVRGGLVVSAVAAWFLFWGVWAERYRRLYRR